MANVSFVEKKLQASGIKCKALKQAKRKDETQNLRLLVLSFMLLSLSFTFNCFADDVKEPNAAGSFYPDNPQELSGMIDSFLNAANPDTVEG